MERVDTGDVLFSQPDEVYVAAPCLNAAATGRVAFGARAHSRADGERRDRREQARRAEDSIVGGFVLDLSQSARGEKVRRVGESERRLFDMDL